MAVKSQRVQIIISLTVYEHVHAYLQVCEPSIPTTLFGVPPFSNKGIIQLETDIHEIVS